MIYNDCLAFLFAAKKVQFNEEVQVKTIEAPEEVEIDEVRHDFISRKDGEEWIHSQMLFLAHLYESKGSCCCHSNSCYSRTSMAQTPLGRGKYVRDRGSSSQ